MSKKSLTKPNENLPVKLDESWDEFAGIGHENVTANDLLIPRLVIAQALSPQVQKNKAEFIPGAEAGDIIDVGTSTLFKEGVLFLPCYYRKDYIEWAPRNSGKGLVKIHSDALVLTRAHRSEDDGRYYMPNGNYIAETAQFFGMNMTAGGQKCYIPMTSTQLKKARKWLTLSTTEKVTRPDGSKMTMPLFWRGYHLSTASESNAEGSWWGWKVERDGTLLDVAEQLGLDADSLKAEAFEFWKQLRSGEAKPVHEDDIPEGDAEGAM